MKKDFIVVLILFIILPILLIFEPEGVFAKAFNWLPDTPNMGFWLIYIALIGCAYILFQNYRSKTNSIGWYIIASIFSGGLICLLYITYSLSHFGF